MLISVCQSIINLNCKSYATKFKTTGVGNLAHKLWRLGSLIQGGVQAKISEE
jgi:hypothetical protein